MKFSRTSLILFSVVGVLLVATFTGVYFTGSATEDTSDAADETQQAIPEISVWGKIWGWIKDLVTSEPADEGTEADELDYTLGVSEAALGQAPVTPAQTTPEQTPVIPEQVPPAPELPEEDPEGPELPEEEPEQPELPEPEGECQSNSDCQASHICYNSQYCAMTPDGVECGEQEGDLQCHKTCTQYSDCTIISEVCRNTEITHGSAIQILRFCAPTGVTTLCAAEQNEQACKANPNCYPDYAPGLVYQGCLWINEIKSEPCGLSNDPVCANGNCELFDAGTPAKGGRCLGNI